VNSVTAAFRDFEPIDASAPTLQIVKSVIERMPESLRAGQMTELHRFAYEVDMVRRRVPPGSTVCDIGAGWGVLAMGLAAVGMRATLLDDFGDPGFHQPVAVAMRELWTHFGLEIVNRDPGRDGLGFPSGSLDVITTFDCIEHWHRSPKRMLREAVDALKPGGLLVIGTPNSANLRKRISALLGRTAWSAMEDWYENEIFRGHVREPNLADLLYIGRDIGLERREVVGRNFAGWNPSRPLWIRAATPIVDHALRLRPSLCSNIYVLGYKP
jgi:SAM-dependent methyltransferase